MVIFVGEDTAIANSILEQLGSKLMYFASIPAITKDNQVISGKFPDGSLFWLAGAYRSWVGVRRTHWNEAVVRDLKGFGLAYNNISSLCPWFRGFGPGAFTWDNWFSRFGYHIYSAAFLQTPVWPYIVVKWGDLISYYTADYIDFTYDDMLMTDFQPWLSANVPYFPMYYINTAGEDFYQKTYFKYGYYFNYSETVATQSIYQGSMCAYADGEKIVVAGFKPMWLSKALFGSIEDLKETTKIAEFSKWLAFGKLTLSPDLFNSKCFIMPTPYVFGMGGIDGTGEVIEYP
jgi:hypothetical protein